MKLNDKVSGAYSQFKERLREEKCPGLERDLSFVLLA
jgi:hypothetical protein